MTFRSISMVTTWYYINYVRLFFLYKYLFFLFPVFRTQYVISLVCCCLCDDHSRSNIFISYPSKQAILSSPLGFKYFILLIANIDTVSGFLMKLLKCLCLKFVCTSEFVIKKNKYYLNTTHTFNLFNAISSSSIGSFLQTLFHF